MVEIHVTGDDMKNWQTHTMITTVKHQEEIHHRLIENKQQ